MSAPKRFRFPCAICGMSFPWKCSLLVHHRVHSKERPYGCTQCKMRFTQSGTLKTHEKRHSGVKGFQCSFCKKPFFSKRQLRLHVLTHTTQGRPFKCQFKKCDASYKDEQELNRHLKHIHASGSWSRFECIFCKKRFPKMEKLHRHIPTHTKETGHFCKFCPAEFGSSDGLRLHLSRTHDPSRKRSHHCDLCDASFYARSSLQLHMLSHTGERPFKCDSCERSFGTRGVLKMHRSTHSSATPFSCDHCSKAFKYKRTYDSHKRSLPCKKVRPIHRCEICGKVFQLNCHLLMHIRRHLGERPEKCRLCEMAFKTHQALVTHDKRHGRKKQRKRNGKVNQV